MSNSDTIVDETGPGETGSVDSLDQLARLYLSRTPGPFRRSPETIAAERWAGIPVEYRRRANGAVVAICLGLTGVGPTEAVALLDLDRRFR